MKRLLSLTLSFAACCSGLVLLPAAPARAQEVAAVSSLDTLRRQYEQMLAVERNAATPPEVRQLNRTFLEERRAQLAAAIRKRIGSLNKYRAAVAAMLGDDEKRVIDDSVAHLSGELRALLPEAVPAPAPAPRRTRRAAHASAPPAPPAEAPSPAEAPAESAGAEPAPPTPSKSDAPIEIVSPARDRVVHTAEVELEVGVNDEEIDDLMVAVYTPASEKPKTARVLSLRRSDRGAKSVVVALSKGDNRIEVSDLKRGGVKAERNINYAPPETSAVGAAAAAFVKPAPAAAPQAAGGNAERRTAPIEYDWGRVRSYFTAGMIFSKEREEFSKSDLALSFVLDKNYYKSLKWNINTFFEARLTSVPVAAQSADGAAGEGEGDGEGDGEDANQLDTFITSKKAGFAQAGVYVPVNVTGWKNQRELNTLFIAPLAKGGVMTITGDRRTAEAETFGDDDVFNFYSFGVRLGHFRYPRLRHPCAAFPKDDNCDSFADYAPELISWLDITTGRWENFELTIPTGQLDGDGNPITTRQRRWRYQAEGRLKIPETPFLVGFDGNFGQGPDDLRFGFGMRFDVAKLIHRLKLQAMFEEEEAQQSDDNNGGATPPER